jgi:hypothetical protein
MVDQALALGGRVELRLESAQGQAAKYALRVESAGVSREGVLRVEEGGAIVVDWPGEAGAEWLEGLARAVVRTAWSQRCKGVAWPRRLSRWRMGTKDG